MQVASFKQRVINSSLWTFGGSALTQLIRFFSNLLMTRLLVPDMFGLMAVAGVLMVGLHLLSDVGLRQIIIQNKRSDETFVNTIWTMQVIRGWIIWILSILVALVFSMLTSHHFWSANSVYSNPIFPYVVAVIGFNSVISGYEPTKLILANRNLSLKITVKIGLTSQIIGISAMLVMAYFKPSVWALVLGGTVAAISQVILSYSFIEGKRNYFCLDRQVFDEIIHFGKWIFLSSTLGFISLSADKLVLGGLVSAEQLGYYAIAGLIAGAIGQLITSVVHAVGFPALSQTFRESPEKLKDVFYKLRLPFDLAATFLAAFIFVAADSIVDVLYDHRYSDVGWILKILALGLFELRYRLCSECFMAMGKPKLQSTLTMVNIVFVYIFGIIGFYYYGFTGLVWVIACSALSTIPLNLYYLHKFNILDWKREFVSMPILFLGYLAGVIVNMIVDKIF